MAYGSTSTQWLCSMPVIGFILVLFSMTSASHFPLTTSSHVYPQDTVRRLQTLPPAAALPSLPSQCQPSLRKTRSHDAVSVFQVPVHSGSRGTRGGRRAHTHKGGRGAPSRVIPSQCLPPLQRSPCERAKCPSTNRHEILPPREQQTGTEVHLKKIRISLQNTHQYRNRRQGMESAPVEDGVEEHGGGVLLHVEEGLRA